MPKMFGAKFPLPVLSEKIIYATPVGVAANSTVYLYGNDQGGERYGGSNASEVVLVVNYLVTRLGLLKNLVVYATAAPGAGESFTYTVRINGAPTAITCAIAGAAQVTASDLVNTAEVVVGDRVTIQLVTSAAASGTTHSTSIAMDTPSTRKPYERVSFTSGVTTIAANTTCYIASIYRYSSTLGSASAAETFALVNHLVTRKGTLKNLVVLAEAAPGAGETFVYTVRVNGAPTAMTVTLAGAAQVTGTDLVNVVQVDPGDRITLQVVTSLAAAVTTHAASFDFEEGDYRAG